MTSFSDIIKIGGEEIAAELAKLYNQILDEKRIPACWKEAKVILLFKKKDDKTDKELHPNQLVSTYIQDFYKDYTDNN